MQRQAESLDRFERGIIGVMARNFNGRFQLREVSMFNRVKKVVVRFNRDEMGMEAIQIVMTLAIAAMVCLGVSKVAGVTASGANGSGIMGKISTIAADFLGDAVSSALGGAKK